ncbi:hypothetical protein TUM12370_16180 [Salmonella enterica subsp. enterica serovar Choleraesuis]|nr:hypothetical protein TUM12370_16180 [Salmonella enterica subsp. enterica serovar Choleraesuis]
MTTRIAAALPAAWGQLVDGLCRQASWLQPVLAEDIARFSQPRLDSGYLAAAAGSSLLGYNGSPLEFTVTTARPQGLSCTMDPVLPQYLAPRRIDVLRPEYYRLAATSPSRASDHCLNAVARWQAPSAPALRFGSWLGRKYDTDGVATKVYSEVPAGCWPDAAWAGSGMCHSTAALASLGLKLLMVGYYPDRPQAAIEYYFQWHSAEIDAANIDAVMQFFGCADRADTLLPLLARTLARLPNADGFPHTTYGFSLAYCAGQLESFTLFTMAPGFFSGNERVSAGLNALLTQEGLTLPLLHPLLAQGVELQFNVLGFSVDSRGQCAVSCTFSPAHGQFEETTRQVPSKPVTAPPLGQLLAGQAPSGAFTCRVRTPDGRWHQDENAFMTAQVVRTLRWSRETAPAIDKALDYLASCAVRPGHYSFWPPEAHPSWMKGEIIAPDVDDSAVITELLYRYDRITQAELDLTLAHINGYRLNRVDPRQAEPQHQWARSRALHTWMREDNDISQLDCCVNTNVLILMHTQAQARGEALAAGRDILDMLERALTWSGDRYERINQLTPWYAHPNEWLAALQYGLSRGIAPFAPLIERLSRWRLPAAWAEIPLYRRHDGMFLWTSSTLNAFRGLTPASLPEGRP